MRLSWSLRSLRVGVTRWAWRAEPSPEEPPKWLVWRVCPDCGYVPQRLDHWHRQPCPRHQCPAIADLRAVVHTVASIAGTPHAGGVALMERMTCSPPPSFRPPEARTHRRDAPSAVG